MRYRFKEPVQLRDRRGERVVAKVELEIDWHRLKMVLGNKAIQNKTGKTRVMRGVITAKAKKQ